jgi:phospholipase A1/A2
MTECKFKYGRYLSCFLPCMAVLCLSTLFLLCSSAIADITQDMQKCADEKIDNKRLECFDELYKQQIQMVEKVTQGKNIQQERPEKHLSVLELFWDLDRPSRKNAPLIRPHHPNYFLLYTSNTTQHDEMMLDVDPKAKAQREEVKFEISGKLRPLPNDLLYNLFKIDRENPVTVQEYILDKLAKSDLWLGYTQLSFWQLYNTPFSAPFRETNYEPEALWNIPTNYDLFGLGLLKGRIFNVGFNHQSNGRARPLSRSWNRIVTNIGFEKVFSEEGENFKRNEFNLLLKAWYRLPESGLDDDNPGIEKYMGYGEIWGYYYFDRLKFGIMLRNNLRTDGNKGAIQLDCSFPIPFINSDRVGLYLQYFNGYGESLIDYNSSTNRISAGFMLMDWN